MSGVTREVGRAVDGGEETETEDDQQEEAGERIDLDRQLTVRHGPRPPEGDGPAVERRRGAEQADRASGRAAGGAECGGEPGTG